MTNTIRKKQSGYGFLEFAIALAVVSVLAAGVAFSLGLAKSSMSSDDLVRDIDLVAKGVQQTHQHLGNYNGLTAARVVASKAVPSYLISGSTIKSGRVTIVPSVSHSLGLCSTRSCGDGFNLRMTTLSKDMCVAVAGKLFGTAHIFTTVDGTKLSSPENISAVMSLCNGSFTHNIVLRFK